MRRRTAFGFNSRLSAFAADTRGNVAIIFALVAVPLAGISALAIDYGRASQAQSVLQRAADAAAEAVLPHLDEGQTHVMAVARTHLDANLPPNLRNLPFTLRIAADKSTIALSVEADIPTSLAGVMGVPNLPARAEANFRVPKQPIMPVEPEVEVGQGQVAVRKPSDAELRELRRQIELIERQLAGAINGGAIPPDVERLLRELARR